VAGLHQRETGLATPHAEPAGEVGVAVLADDLVVQGDELRLPRRRLAAVTHVQRHAGCGPRRDAHRSALAIVRAASAIAWADRRPAVTACGSVVGRQRRLAGSHSVITMPAWSVSGSVSRTGQP
jgi:hypothetical protein